LSLKRNNKSGDQFLKEHTQKEVTENRLAQGQEKKFMPRAYCSTAVSTAKGKKIMAR
jgi:hypothetical protein